MYCTLKMGVIWWYCQYTSKKGGIYLNISLGNVNQSAVGAYETALNNRVQKQKSALRIILESQGNSKGDTLRLPNNTKIFTKDEIAALIDGTPIPEESQLIFYFENYNNSKAILDAVNFGKKVSCGYNPDFKDFGITRIEVGGKLQIIPNYAVPKMIASGFPEIKAINNSLILDNKNYYSWTSCDGRTYPWAVSDGRIGWAKSELMLSYDDIPDSSGYRKEMSSSGSILSALAKGGRGLLIFDKKDILDVCEHVGIEKGFFTVDAGAGTHHYYLRDSGKVENIDSEIDNLNSTNWIKLGYKQGDAFSVFGNEYTLDSEGYLHISKEDAFTCYEIVYPE